MAQSVVSAVDKMSVDELEAWLILLKEGRLPGREHMIPKVEERLKQHKLSKMLEGEKYVLP